MQNLFQIVAYACICPNSTVINEMDSQMDADLTRCCPETLQIHHDDKYNGSVSCPLNKGNEVHQNVRECKEPNFWEEIMWDTIQKKESNDLSMQVSSMKQK